MAIPPFFSLLALSLFGLSVAADVFVSIDCGSSTSYKDENGITWTGEGNYTRAGESRSVPSSNSISHVINTLRVFPTGIKNCYHIDSVQRGRVLLRATFYYGNYDNRSSPPTFDLQFDGNHWATVETSSSEYVWYEVIYVMKKDSISVCVARRNPGEFPFVSALEVRALETFMYRHVDDGKPLLLRRRVAYGTNATVRYQDDPYDRIWSPDAFNTGSIKISNNAIFNEVVISSDRPPPIVLNHAVTATSPNASLELYMGLLPDESSVYINWYFSEVAQLTPNQTRSFRIFKDNKSLSEPILPPYYNCTELYDSNITASSNTSFSLVPTNGSTLPPLINAMEVFFVGEEMTSGTNEKDVRGLASLQTAFVMLQGWSGDPCLPKPYTWDWIECNNDTIPRVTSLFLGSFGLSGLLPDFSSMDALRTIDLHNNSLQGPIPDFLGTLPNLKMLNLANNRFNGTIPDSLSSKKNLTLVVFGNSELCTSATLCTVSPAANSCITNNVQILFGSIISFTIMLQLRLLESA